MLIDAHTHLRPQDWDLLPHIALRDNLVLLPNGGTPGECARLARLAQRKERVIPTCGIHPWMADQIFLEEMRPHLEGAPIIGEIGLDSVWCNVELPVQRKVFLAQLEMAQQAGKPVLLHTKGCEEEIAAILRPYTMRKLVHWYSCMDHLNSYIEQGCWFTVGPNPADPAVLQVAQRVPLDRLLLETDGLSAVEWATGHCITPQGLRGHLQRMAEWVASLRGITAQCLIQQMESNFAQFSSIILREAFE